MLAHQLAVAAAYAEHIVLGGSAAHRALNKLYNWSCLNKRVFRKLGFVLSKAECEAVCNCSPGAVERVLKLVQVLCWPLV